jgi:Holliday junction resolvase-like predicted endonuclease
MESVRSIAETSRPLEIQWRASRYKIAEQIENLVGILLQEKGWQMLERRLRGRGYELDLCLLKNSVLLVVEVKYIGLLQGPLNQFHIEGRINFRKKLALRRGALIATMKFGKEFSINTTKVIAVFVSKDPTGQLQTKAFPIDFDN